RVRQHDLADVGRHVRGLLRLSRDVDVHALLREVDHRHEDDEQDEQDVDERRDVHVRTCVQDFRLDDLVGAEVMMRVCHYWPPPAPAFLFACTISAMSSTPAWCSASIAVITELYSAS